MILQNKLQKKVVNYFGCSIQHNGWPCNSCFHTIGEELNLAEDIHDYWVAVLAFRGDYPELEQRSELIEELYNKIGDSRNE